MNLSSWSQEVSYLRNVPKLPSNCVAFALYTKTDVPTWLEVRVVPNLVFETLFPAVAYISLWPHWGLRSEQRNLIDAKPNIPVCDCCLLEAVSLKRFVCLRRVYVFEVEMTVAVRRHLTSHNALSAVWSATALCCSLPAYLEKRHVLQVSYMGKEVGRESPLLMRLVEGIACVKLVSNCLDNRLTDGGKVISPTHRPHLTPQKHLSFVAYGGFYIYLFFCF
jgi:hypothetical protein